VQKEAPEKKLHWRKARSAARPALPTAPLLSYCRKLIYFSAALELSWREIDVAFFDDY
jgi:hypothetical protein